jgi:HNH endonuclease/AP2 domain
MKNKEYNSINWNEIFVEDVSSPTELKWKISPARCAKAGDVAGSIWTNKQTGQQYCKVVFNKTSWYVHRILWVMRNGSIEVELDIDHLDGNGLNNSVDNLRLVSTAVNSRNKKQRNNNSSGVTGVSFKTNGKGNTYAVSRWCDLLGKEKSKNFPCAKLGLLPAFAAACAYREKMLAELNETGACYSSRHCDR